MSPLVSNFLYKWSDNFFFILSKTRSWPFGLVWRHSPRLTSFYHWPQLLEADHELVQCIAKTLKVNMKGEVSHSLLEFASIYELL